MNIILARRLGAHWRLVLVLSFSILVLAGCGQDPEPERTAAAVPVPSTTQAAFESTPVATPVPAPDKPEGSSSTSSGPPPTTTRSVQPAQSPATPASIATTAPSPTPAPNPPSAQQPTLAPVPVNTPTPLPLPFLDLLFPQDGSVLEVAAVRVLGTTQIGAVATVNGTVVEIHADGSFQSDLALDVGLNTINVVVTDQLGRSDSRSAAVFVVPAADPLPFNVFYPRDGIDVGQRDLPVSGVTKPDAVVLVNGISVEVNALGIYSAVVVLEDDTNLIEVVATDIFGNLRSQTIAVFYTP